MNCPRGEIPVPTHAHPLVQQLVRLANREQMSLRQLSKKSNGHHQAVSNWLRRSNPRLDTFEAALNVLGYELKIVERRE